MAQHRVVRSVPHADPADIEALAECGTATVHEAIGRRGFVGPELRPIQQGVRLAGSAVTVSCHPGDNLMVHAAIEVCGPGDVLVVTTTALSTHGMFGELMATSVMARGVRALVVDAGVRDTAELRAMGFAVWSRHVSCQGTVKASPGSVNLPVVLGGVVVSPGDVVVADDDGVVVVAREDAAWAVAQSRAREARRRRHVRASPPASSASTSTACARCSSRSASSTAIEHTVTEAVASNRSSWMVTTWRGLPA